MFNRHESNQIPGPVEPQIQGALDDDKNITHYYIRLNSFEESNKKYQPAADGGYSPELIEEYWKRYAIFEKNQLEYTGRQSHGGMVLKGTVVAALVVGAFAGNNKFFEDNPEKIVSLSPAADNNVLHKGSKAKTPELNIEPKTPRPTSPIASPSAEQLPIPNVPDVDAATIAEKQRRLQAAQQRLENARESLRALEGQKVLDLSRIEAQQATILQLQQRLDAKPKVVEVDVPVPGPTVVKKVNVPGPVKIKKVEVKETEFICMVPTGITGLELKDGTYADGEFADWAPLSMSQKECQKLAAANDKKFDKQQLELTVAQALDKITASILGSAATDSDEVEVKPSPSENPQPSSKPSPSEGPKPSDEPKPSEDSQPSEDAHPHNNPKPADDPKPPVNPSEAEGPAPIVGESIAPEPKPDPKPSIDEPKPPKPDIPNNTESRQRPYNYIFGNALSARYTRGGEGLPGYASGNRRGEMLGRLLRRNDIDFAAFSEFLSVQSEGLERATKGEYQAVGVNGDTSRAVIYNRDTFKVTAVHAIKTVFYGGKIIRVPRVTLQDRKTGEKTDVISGHFVANSPKYPNGEKLRDRATVMVSNAIAELRDQDPNRRIIFTADTNDHEEVSCELMKDNNMVSPVAPSCDAIGRISVVQTVATPNVAFEDYDILRSKLQQEITDHAQFYKAKVDFISKRQ